jgi:hypothetical protein
MMELVPPPRIGVHLNRCHNQRLFRTPRFSLSVKIKGEKRGFINLGIMHKM